MYKLIKFTWDCGRGGDISGLFIWDEEDYNKILGKRIYFGEILGKHSEISGTIEEADLTIISEDQDLINKLLINFPNYNLCGYNPLDYYEEDNEE